MSFNPIHNSKFNFFQWAGIDFTGALAKDGYFSVEPTADITSAAQDAGGYNVSVSMLSDKSAELSVQLNMQSPVNVELERILAEQERRGRLVVSNMTIDAKGTLYLDDYIDCFIKGRPSPSVGEDISDSTNTWTFYCRQLRPKSLDATILDGDLKARVSAAVDVSLGEFSASLGGVLESVIDL